MFPIVRHLSKPDVHGGHGSRSVRGGVIALSAKTGTLALVVLLCLFLVIHALLFMISLLWIFSC